METVVETVPSLRAAGSDKDYQYTCLPFSPLRMHISIEEEQTTDNLRCAVLATDKVSINRFLAC
jgi:hypothetical protein